MIKWDSTSFPDVKTLWFARAQGNEWALVSSGPAYENAKVAITAKPDGKVEIGPTDPKAKSEAKLEVKGLMICDGIVLRERRLNDFIWNSLKPGTIIWDGEYLYLLNKSNSWRQLEMHYDSPHNS